MSTTERVDVLIVGAGISGIGVAYHLMDQRPGTTFAILEAHPSYGGTWWTHRYPGVRSDSDLFTLGYRFKAWKGNPIARGEQILAYLGEVIEDNDLDRHIRYRHRVDAAEWSSDSSSWTVTATDLDADEEVQLTAGFIWMCQGYYDHQTPHLPRWEGDDDFEGTIIHPQQWPSDVDLTDKKVVVIGSGATAATLIPALADDVEHVTMLQRSPTYFMARPNSNELANTLRELDIPPEWTHEIVRRQIFKTTEQMRQASSASPDAVRRMVIEETRKQLPEGFDVERHFTPAYRVWQQRLALLPDGDLFAAIRSGKASVVTDTIERFTAKGIETASGEHLDADVIIAATGFDLSVFGGIDYVVDGEEIDPADLITYRGIMFTGLPNLAYIFGYFRASWTLRVDIIADFVCRVLTRMDELGAASVVPTLRDDEREMGTIPWVDPENFNPGYLTRSLHLMPQQGDRDPWRWGLEYAVEKEVLAAADLDDGSLTFR